MSMHTYRQLTAEALAFQSVSTDPAYAKEITRTAQWFAEQFAAHGFTVEVIPGYGNPLVVARYTADQSAETCLIYGHYDVQPADNEGWLSDPFTLTERDGRLYGRGVIDNKGQVMVHIASIFDLIARGQLAYNVVFLLEGDEETGGGDLPRFIAEHREKIACDLVMISDGELVENLPTLELGFRGVMNLSLTVRTLSTDLHSGLYGNVAPNAIHELSQLLSSLTDADGRLTIPGFYENLPQLTASQQAKVDAAPWSAEDFKASSGARAVLREDFFTATGLEPTVQVTGIQGGYTGVGYRNGIPATATAKINLRVAPTQDPAALLQAFKTWAERTVPAYVTLTWQDGETAHGTMLETDNPYAERAITHLQAAYNHPVVYKYCGGTLPIAYDIQRHMQVPQLYVSLANTDCGMHAANENFALPSLEAGLRFSQAFFSTRA